MVRLWPRIGKLGISAQMAVRHQLEHEEFAAFEDRRTGRANVALMMPLDRGCELLGEPNRIKKGKRSVGHNHGVNWLGQYYERRGHRVVREYRVARTDHFTDLAVIDEGRLHAFEVIASCTRNLTGHCQACFVEADCVAALTIVTFTQKELGQIRTMLHSEPTLQPFHSRITFEVITPYLQEFCNK